MKQLKKLWCNGQNFLVMLEEWEEIWKTNVKMTKAILLKENTYKMFYSWHLSPRANWLKCIKVYLTNVGNVEVIKAHFIICGGRVKKQRNFGG